MFGKERRRYKRIRAHCLVKYTLPEGVSGISFVRVISAGGILMHSSSDIARGTEISVKINFPGFPGAIAAKGTVLKSRKLRKIQGCETAVQFTEIDEKSKNFLDTAIRKALQK